MQRASAGCGIFVLLFAATLTYAGEMTLNILHVNDHHSYIEEYATSLVTSSLPLSNTTIKSVDIKYGGYPRIAQYLNTTTLPNVLKLHAGDALTGTLWYTLFKGDADARMMGYACFDAFELGNHEFDSGTTLQTPTQLKIILFCSWSLFIHFFVLYLLSFHSLSTQVTPSLPGFCRT
jgi:2',3'-cyclic-nucleotide 2'-phosphodiesterase (5'-nucleotidase family)